MKKARKRPLAYYAHPIELFGTVLEDDDVEDLKRMGFRVFNPADHQREYETQGRMEYCRRMASKCDIIAFRRINPMDRKLYTRGRAADMFGRVPKDIGAGVLGEIEVGIEGNKPILELPWRLDMLTRGMTIKQTRAHLKRIGWYDRQVTRRDFLSLFSTPDSEMERIGMVVGIRKRRKS